MAAPSRRPPLNEPHRLELDGWTGRVAQTKPAAKLGAPFSSAAADEMWESETAGDHTNEITNQNELSS